MRRFVAAVASLLVVSAVTLGGCAADTEGDDESLLDDLDPEVSADDEPSEVASSSDALYGCNQCNNCVYYARCRNPRLPGGLFSYQDKVRRINRRTPKAGCTAVIKTGRYYGHVAHVRAVSGSKIYLDEGNWPGGRCGRRSGTKSSLRITGFIC